MSRDQRLWWVGMLVMYQFSARKKSYLLIRRKYCQWVAWILYNDYMIISGLRALLIFWIIRWCNIWDKFLITQSIKEFSDNLLVSHSQRIWKVRTKFERTWSKPEQNSLNPKTKGSYFLDFLLVANVFLASYKQLSFFRYYILNSAIRHVSVASH